MKIVLATAIFLLLAVSSANTGDVTRHGELMIKDVWSRATPARHAVAYMTILKLGAGKDRLIAAESAIAKKAELHTHSMRNGVMRMRRVSAVEVHPGEPAILEPGGNHVMLMGLHRSLKEGETFSVILIFEKAGKVRVDVAVQKAGAMGIGNTGHGDHKRGGYTGHKHGS